MIQFGLFLPATFLFLRFPVRKGIAYGKVRMKHQCGVEALALTILEAFDKRGTTFSHQLNDLLIGQYLAMAFPIMSCASMIISPLVPG